MKKKAKLVILLLISFVFMVSYTHQTDNTGLITYVQRHSNTLLGGDDFYLGELQFKDQQVFYTYKTLPSHTPSKDTMDAQGNRVLFYGRSVDGGRSTGNRVFINYQNGQVIAAHRIRNEPFSYTDTLPNMAWKITDERKSIGGFHCQKATGHFRGRVYDAWFAPEIPVPYGPWKLGGLPGLILAADTQDGELSFMLDVLQIPAKETLTIRPPKSAIQFADFSTFWEKTNQFEQQTIEQERLRRERMLKTKFPDAGPINIGQIKTDRFVIEKLDD